MKFRLKKLLDSPAETLREQVREAICLKHDSYRTKESYVYWVHRYILFHNKQHPKDRGTGFTQKRGDRPWFELPNFTEAPYFFWSVGRSFGWGQVISRDRW